MKGIIFNLLEQTVTDEYGEDTWDQLLDTTGIEGVYTAVGTYEDDELQKLVEAAAAKLGQSGDDVVRWFGRKAFPLLAGRYPGFFEGHAGSMSFLLTLNDVIHPEVRKLFPGAYAPTFDFERIDHNTLALGYESYRGLCAFAEGLVAGTADHFRDTVTIDQTQCTQRGDAKCVIRCRFSSDP